VTDYAAIARENSVRGSLAFYAIVHNRKMPEHAIPWIEEFHDNSELLLKAFRGGTKTTTMATELAHQMGIRPDGTVLMVRASDPASAETAELIANMIEHNPGWAAVFPGIVPDKEKGWSQNGYFVWDKNQDYGEWSRMVSVRKDPSLAAMGYSSKALHGYHPSIAIWLDDLMDDENAYSAREMQRLKRIISGTILPMRLVNRPRVIISGVPWTMEDAISAAQATGMYHVIETWVYDKNGEPTWPEMFDKEAIEKERKSDLTGGIEFSRNFLGDLNAAKNRVFVFHNYPHDLISTSWPFVGGADPAGVMDPTKRTMDHSHFALAYLAKLPEGGAVVYDGVLEQFSYAEGEESILTAQNLFPSWEQTVVEGDGVGEVFLAMLYRHPQLHLMPKKSGGKSKAHRLVNELGPWLRIGRVRISTAETKFLNALRSFLNRYPAVSEHDPGWDAADAVYLALCGMPDTLAMANPEKAFPEMGGRKHSAQPWSKLRSN
jgi:hypothetical protein